ncbi:helix-turn-helix transcriptional regulator [Lentibacter sp. XHP0401]|uniref:helix-turn-helix transcriptional regulator n=1 Tax=Lentibacter sp. XHP0401 TaxID=2984334 RepID=UPI0021E8602B|nr:helix-turn-helix transcriptional regulator [Lentibacter sp. XHP0401]MCV2894529.1 helix-turn-helix transcriptional regulator [Lentibacter sp. XHP0401]
MGKLSVTQLRIIFYIQVVCVALFFLGTYVEYNQSTAQSPGWDFKTLVRLGIGLGLVIGTFVGWRELRFSRHRSAETELKLRAASNAFMEVMAEHFEQWGLTPAESDVALFSLKGMKVNEIAELRGTSQGTVKAQTNAIYRKSGVSGRPQLLSIFIEDLIQDELPAHMSQAA